MSIRQSWAFALDGHVFYVLGDVEGGTLLYDFATGQWCMWQTPGETFLNLRYGTVWRGRVIAGAEDSNQVMVLDPDEAEDDYGVPAEITRVVTGFQPVRGKDSTRQGALRLICDVGSLPGGVSMRFSDDNGKTWSTPRTRPLDPGNTEQRIEWRSLGRLRSPGRLWEIVDVGGPVRLDGLEADLDGTQEPLAE